MLLLRSASRLSLAAQAARRCVRNLSGGSRFLQRQQQQSQSLSSKLSSTAPGNWYSPRPALRPPLTPRAYSTAAGDGASAAPVSGFSYPGPRKLNEIVKIQLLNKHGAPRVCEIWSEYHKDHKSAVGDTLSAEEYGLLLQRTQRCRHFIFPVPRERGFFTLLVQFQGKQCFMTYLEDYKQNAAGAQPYLTITMFDEMLETKGLALLRGEVTNQLTRPEAKVLMELLKQFYLGPRRNYDAVVAFNEESEKFDFNIVLRAAGVAA